jgi:hypothetical protein
MKAANFELPLNCIDPSKPEQLGQPCDGCPLIEQSIGCAAMKNGAEIAVAFEEKDRQISDLEESNFKKDEINKKLLERILDLRIDSLVDTAYTPEGFKDLLMRSPELKDELTKMQWGVVRLDGRFVGHVNKFGNRVGDLFLQEGGQAITAVADGLVRRKTDRRKQSLPVSEDRRAHERRKEERRVGQTAGGDYICRQGGDEFSLLIRNVGAADLTVVAARIQNQLTIGRALERYADGNIPFIASVGYTHASEEAPKVTAALTEGDPWEAFLEVNGRADEGQRHNKLGQYQEMWKMVVKASPGASHGIAQPDDRVVAERFLLTLCPDFYHNPIQYMEDMLKKRRQASE